MRIRTGLAVVCCAAVMVLLMGSKVAAQSFSAQVLDSETRAPVAGAFVELLVAGRRLSATLSDSLGRFKFRSVEPRSALRVRMLGYVDNTIERDSVSEAQAILLHPGAVSLSRITVEGTRRCGGSAREAGAVYLIWRDAGRALTVIEWVSNHPNTAFVTRTRESLRRIAGDELVSSSEQLDTITSRPPFRTVTPTEAGERGLAIGTPEGAMEFLAPGADYLLSEEFAERHCFTTVRRKGKVGLRFFTSVDDKRPDVEGTLWVSETTSALSSLDFRFTGVETPLRTQAGGNLVFAYTGQGLWYIRSWRLWAPVMTQRALVPGANVRWIARHSFMKERAGEVMQVIWRGEPDS